jgi:hypothetical protein
MRTRTPTSRNSARVRTLPRALVLTTALAVLLVGCGDPNGEQDLASAPGARQDPPAVEDGDELIDDTDSPEPVAEDCSAQGAEADVVAADLPAEVAALRDLLIDAALRCDEQLLRTAIDESDSFNFSFGGETDAIAYWRGLEEAGEQPYLRLVQVLSTTPAQTDDMVVWPQVATGEPEHTTDEAWAELTWMSEEEIAASRGGTGYLGWRVGISPDGEWRFFVAGD